MMTKHKIYIAIWNIYKHKKCQENSSFSDGHIIKDYAYLKDRRSKWLYCQWYHALFSKAKLEKKVLHT